MDFLGDSSTSAALDVVFFVREMCETHPALVPSVLERLRDNFATIRCVPASRRGPVLGGDCRGRPQGSDPVPDKTHRVAGIRWPCARLRPQASSLG